MIHFPFSTNIRLRSRTRVILFHCESAKNQSLGKKASCTTPVTLISVVIRGRRSNTAVLIPTLIREPRTARLGVESRWSKGTPGIPEDPSLDVAERRGKLQLIISSLGIFHAIPKVKAYCLVSLCSITPQRLPCFPKAVRPSNAVRKPQEP
ncbi:hypothetical protein VTI74DRAFT_1099 [Chaetomium olivicolor]